MKTSSLTAIAVAAGLMLSMGSSFAADLGGNCCADLEERVAELEATSVRKGTRKTTLEIYGQVNRAITYWDDGSRSNANIGADNHNSSTRFGLRGNAKIYTGISTGYSILIDVADKDRTSTFSQIQDAGSSKFAAGGATRTGDDQAIRMRDANWWVESARLGRVTIGRLTHEGITGTIDIANIQAGVGSDVSCNGGGLLFRGKNDGILSKTSIGSLAGGGAGACSALYNNRGEAIKYTSPNYQGFQFVADLGRNAASKGINIDSSASNAAQEGQEFSAAIRYAGEHQGIRIAGQAGYQQGIYNRDENGGQFANGDAILTVNSATPAAPANFASGKTRTWELTGGALHVPTGLFIQGEYTRFQFETLLTKDGQATIGGLPIGALAGSRDATRWGLEAGLQRNWFGVGNTSIYGEYYRSENFQYANSAGISATAVSGDRLSNWGIGMNQAVDSAAMDLYSNYRNFSGRDPNLAASTGSLKDISVITTGARIKF